MSQGPTARSPFERVRDRYENSEKKCPDCGYIGEDGEWKSETDGRVIVYQYRCSSCNATRRHVFNLER
ncbi:HVO_0649 family zinc finger protein [Halalkalicoccus tibetensis]|uniref:HVO_0649 family zinc finger protein n=1 Tax=Halalkalicoccus tibetensis TaxID=175632 RepID=A0ABD5V605_9EURY